MNSRNTLPANSTPTPSEIQRSRGASGAGRWTSRSQANMSASPRTPRTVEIVSTPAPSLSTILLSTSAQANDEAASSAGPISARRLPACEEVG